MNEEKIKDKFSAEEKEKIEKAKTET